MLGSGLKGREKDERSYVLEGLGFTGNGKNGSHQILYGAPAGV